MGSYLPIIQETVVVDLTQSPPVSPVVVAKPQPTPTPQVSPAVPAKASTEGDDEQDLALAIELELGEYSACFVCVCDVHVLCV